MLRQDRIERIVLMGQIDRRIAGFAVLLPTAGVVPT